MTPAGTALLAATAPLRTALASRAALLLLGLALLLAGRKLFWLAVGVLGFVAGYQAMEQWGRGLPPAATLVVALVVGLLGIVLALVVQRVAVALAGFLLGVVLLSLLLPLTAVTLGPWHGVVVAAGGLLGAVVGLALFELALVVITAGAGATLLVQALVPHAPWAPLLLIALWIAGVIVQRRFQK